MDKFEAGTGRTIDSWMDYIRNHKDGDSDLNALDHKHLAKLAEEGGASGWWAQGIAVEIERIIGRRNIGQRNNGEYEAAASKTVPGEWTTNFEAFDAFMSKGTDVLPAAIDGESETSSTEKWRYWRAELVDGTKVVVTCTDGSTAKAEKTKFGLQHTKLESAEQRGALKQHWKEALAKFKDSLE